MVVVLLAITAIASASVGGIYILTEEPIALAEQNAKKAALAQVLPPFENTEVENLKIDELDIEVYTATNGSEVVGYAINTATMSGFSGFFSLMVGLTPEGEVINVNVLKHSETPGLGSKMTDEGNSLLMSIKDRNLNDINWNMKKEGGDIDALTAATISSRAYADAMQRAMAAFNQVTSNEKGESNE